MCRRSYRLAFTLLVAASCTGTPAPEAPDAAVPDADVSTCRLETVLAERVGAADPSDCGQLSLDDDDAAFVAAHDCAVEAAAAEQPFVVVWDRPSIDSRFASAILGVDRGGTWTLETLVYDGNPYGTGYESAPVTSTGVCAGLADLGDCGLERRQSLCLACVDASDWARCPPL